MADQLRRRSRPLAGSLELRAIDDLSPGMSTDYRRAISKRPSPRRQKLAKGLNGPELSLKVECSFSIEVAMVDIFYGSRRLGAAVILMGIVLVSSGCIRTQEMPLAPNVVRINTHASGLLFAGQATSQTMRRAAELTLQSGYSHFRFEQAQVSQGSQLSGVYSSASGNAYGTAYGNNAYVNANASGVSTPIYRPTADVGVTVIMFHADEPGAKGAFDATEVLKRAS